MRNGISTERRALLGVLAGALFAAPFPVNSQPAGKVYRIGYLSGGTSAAGSQILAAFLEGLQKHGWIEGKNIVIDYRFADGRYDRLPELAGELVRLKVDVIVAAPTPPAAAAKKATTEIPIVMIGAGADPVGQGLVASLAHPGGNVTGLAYSVGQEIFGKQLALLIETVPKVRNVAVLWNPTVPTLASAITEVQTAARSLGLQLQLVEVRTPDEFDGAFAAMSRERAGALIVLVDSMLSSHGKRLAELAVNSRMPAIFTNRLPVEAGGLMSYGPNFSALWRRAADFVDKILRGAKPADLPVEQPTSYQLVINMKAAKAIGLTMPQSLLLRADEVIR